MQVVIELGRYLRDRKVVPVKVRNVTVIWSTSKVLLPLFNPPLQFPLPEVVVVQRNAINEGVHS